MPSLNNNQLRTLHSMHAQGGHRVPGQAYDMTSLVKKGLVQEDGGKRVGNTRVWNLTEQGKSLARRVKLGNGKYEMGPELARVESASKLTKVRLGNGREVEVIGEKQGGEILLVRLGGSPNGMPVRRSTVTEL